MGFLLLFKSKFSIFNYEQKENKMLLSNLESVPGHHITSKLMWSMAARSVLSMSDVTLWLV